MVGSVAFAGKFELTLGSEKVTLRENKQAPAVTFEAQDTEFLRTKPQRATLY